MIWGRLSFHRALLTGQGGAWPATWLGSGQPRLDPFTATPPRLGEQTKQTQTAVDARTQVTGTRQVLCWSWLIGLISLWFLLLLDDNTGEMQSALINIYIPAKWHALHCPKRSSQSYWRGELITVFLLRKGKGQGWKWTGTVEASLDLH